MAESERKPKRKSRIYILHGGLPTSRRIDGELEASAMDGTDSEHWYSASSKKEKKERARAEACSTTGSSEHITMITENIST